MKGLPLAYNRDLQEDKTAAVRRLRHGRRVRWSWPPPLVRQTKLRREVIAVAAGRRLPRRDDADGSADRPRRADAVGPRGGRQAGPRVRDAQVPARRPAGRDCSTRSCPAGARSYAARSASRTRWRRSGATARPRRRRWRSRWRSGRRRLDDCVTCFVELCILERVPELLRLPTGTLWKTTGIEGLRQRTPRPPRSPDQLEIAPQNSALHGYPVDARVPDQLHTNRPSLNAKRSRPTSAPLQRAVPFRDPTSSLALRSRWWLGVVHSTQRRPVVIPAVQWGCLRSWGRCSTSIWSSSVDPPATAVNRSPSTERADGHGRSTS